MILSSTHNHCTLCDGKSTAEEMIQAAIAAGFTDLGFSSHGVTPFDLMYSLKDEASYINTVRALQKKYAGRIRIACGIEQDWYAPVHNREQLDYIIGSVHYLRSLQGRYYSVDATREEAQACVQDMFAGNGLAYAAAYYDLVARQAEVCHPEIIGHFDLVTLYNRNNELFDENSEEYRAMALAALRRCVAAGCIIEMNSGAMARGYMQRPYPATFLLEALQKMGGRVMLNADCHDAKNICFGFEKMESTLRTLGFTEVTVLQDGKFVPQALG